MITRGRGFHMLVGGATLGVVLWSASTGCKLGGDATGPPPPCGANVLAGNCVGVMLSVVADTGGRFSFSVNGDSLQGHGQANETYGLAPGTYTVTGTLMTPSVVTFFITTNGTFAGGGVERLSLQSTKGPFVATPSLCHVSYSATGSSPPPQDYSFSFTIGTTGPLC